MTIPSYNPELRVLLTKTVTRKNGVASRYAGMPRQIDLTPYLGDAGVVRTVKNLSSPAGAFSISFADQPDHAFGDTLYALIEPMDMIEIRAAREPGQYVGKPLPLIMRGYVSSVRRSETIDMGGKPQRTVTVDGQDSGKLWLINRIYFSAALATDAAYLPKFKLQVALGINVSVMSVSDFVTAITNDVMNDKVAQMAAYSDQVIKPFKVDSTVTQGDVIPEMVMNIDAVPLWSLIAQFADQPWNELFIQDQEDGPHVVFRPVPYKDITGTIIDPLAADPGWVLVDMSDVVALDMMRSDSRTANFFWVPPGGSIIDTQGGVAVASLRTGEPFDFEHPNNTPALYGVRQMIAQSNLTSLSTSQPPLMLPPDQRQAGFASTILWFEARARLLKLMNRDNGVLEEGTATLKGSEILVPGKYLRILRGSLVSESYIQQVAHTFTPLRTWTTSVILARGNGFLARSKAPGAPYLAEGRPGPYTPVNPVSMLNALQNAGVAPAGAFSVGGFNFGASSGAVP